MEGERFGLRPLSPPAADDDAELYQIVLSLKSLADNQTHVAVHCEYKPRHHLAKIKNLAFLRRLYWRRLEASLEALESVVNKQVLLIRRKWIIGRHSSPATLL